MPYSKGDVILVRFPFADLTEYKKRPALVIQSEAVATGLEQWLVAKITSNLDRTGDSRVLVGKDSAEGHEMGLLTDSVIVLDHIATVVDREVDQVLGRCSDLSKIDDALCAILGLSVRRER